MECSLFCFPHKNCHVFIIDNHSYDEAYLSFIRVGSDGNCLFRSVSVALTGTEEASNDLRLLSSIELYENAEHYAPHHHFDNVLNSLALYSTSSNNLFIQALSDVGCEIYRNTK